jgi:predicted AlkP superfamily pyrophosphatase or phosphodiesterase
MAGELMKLFIKVDTECPESKDDRSEIDRPRHPGVTGGSRHRRVRRLSSRRGLDRRAGDVLRTVAAAATASVLGIGLLAAAKPVRPVSLVLVSVDGLRPDYVLEADRYGLAVPNLRRFVREGAFASGVAGVAPTITFPSHITQVTGVSPARHGISANEPFGATGGDGGVSSWSADDIRVPTLWDAAADRGFVTSSVDWPVTAGARITYNIPQYWRPQNAQERKLQRLLVTPGLFAEAEKVLGPYPASHLWGVDQDERRAAFNTYLIETRKPRLHLAYLAGLDEAEHASGPFSPAAAAALTRIDALVGRIRRAAEANGPAIVAVTSDHGFRRTRHELHLNAALRAAGLVRLGRDGKIASWSARAWGMGGSAAILLRDPRDDAARATVSHVLEELAADPRAGIARVLQGGEVAGSGGFEGAAFVVGLRGEHRFGDDLYGPTVREGEPWGTHGNLPDDRAMDAAFFVAGPGIAAGRRLGRIDMRDIAPTLAARLDLTLPHAEGRDVLR